MIEIEKYKLDNGLRVILSPQKGAQMACVNLMYDVGARDESADRTGFAHLFEHLMFGGTDENPVFDELVENAGGSNNAFTSNDVTNYYINIPFNNLETALYLEADRMRGLSFSQNSLDVQKQVVVEEFKQRYINQPYGDVFSLLRPLAYKVHPYQWPTIGKEMSHIETAEMPMVKSFFKKHYGPNNAVLCLSGGFDSVEAKELIQKYFGSIPTISKEDRNLPQEPAQDERRFLEVNRSVPAKALYMAFPIPGRSDKDYPAYDLISDILGYGEGSRLHQDLVEKKGVFSSLSAFVGGDVDPGLFYVAGFLSEGVELAQAEKEVWTVLKNLSNNLSEAEVERNKQKFLTRFMASQVQSFHIAMNLCYHELSGDASEYNKVIEHYEAITSEGIKQLAGKLFDEKHSNILYYNNEQ